MHGLRNTIEILAILARVVLGAIEEIRGILDHNGNDDDDPARRSPGPDDVLDPTQRKQAGLIRETLRHDEE